MGKLDTGVSRQSHKKEVAPKKKILVCYGQCAEDVKQDEKNVHKLMKKCVCVAFYIEIPMESAVCVLAGLERSSTSRNLLPPRQKL